MSQNIKKLYGDKLVAVDGNIGRVKDFYFDDECWVIRYLVADTGSWLGGRLVLIFSLVFGKLDQDQATLHIHLPKKQIEDSPPIESQQPASRHYEADYYRYYGWRPYWNGGPVRGPDGYPMVRPTTKDESEANSPHLDQNDTRLLSSKAVIGYRVEAIDGAVGQISGFRVDDLSWAISEMVVETGPWFWSRKVPIPAGKIRRISREESKIFVNLTKAEIRKVRERELAKDEAGPQAAKGFHA